MALGLGDQELEQRLRPALDAVDDLSIVAQCLSADQILELVQANQVDAVVIAWTLHRLTEALLDQLERPGLTVVLLVPDPADERWQDRSLALLPMDADADQVREALLSSLPGVRMQEKARMRVENEPVALKPADRLEPQSGGVIAIAGGVGSPGRTTVAINLAAALGSVQTTVLVEADLSGPAAAAYLDLDPTRNICTLAHAIRDDPRLWSAALHEELQPLGAAPLASLVLCGPPKREMRTSVSPALLEQLIAELASRFRWVVLDVGVELLGSDTAAASHRVALTRAQHVLLVTAADFVGLWHARTALEQFERLLGIERSSVNIVLNRHDARFHHSHQEVAWHLGAPVVASIPFDQVAIQRSISEQRPVVLDPGARSGRALLQLAESLNDGKLRTPWAEQRKPWWRRAFERRTRRVANRSIPPRPHLHVGEAGRTTA